MKILEAVAKLFSIAGGLLMVGITLMTCYSLIGRNFLGTSLIGDFELTAIGCGMAIAFFMPYCQLRREHIIVDFFTAHLPSAVNSQFDRMGALVMTLLY
ncbi:MAG: TRAP transporter small permease, partial [Limnohabitans sp.]